MITPPFGRLAAEEGRLEGEYRAAHARLITSAEEIAFYKGEVIEKSTLLKHYRDLVVHVKDMIVRRIGFGIIEGFTLKYVSRCVARPRPVYPFLTCPQCNRSDYMCDPRVLEWQVGRGWQRSVRRRLYS